MLRILRFRMPVRLGVIAGVLAVTSAFAAVTTAAAQPSPNGPGQPFCPPSQPSQGGPLADPPGGRFGGPQGNQGTLPFCLPNHQPPRGGPQGDPFGGPFGFGGPQGPGGPFAGQQGNQPPPPPCSPNGPPPGGPLGSPFGFGGSQTGPFGEPRGQGPRPVSQFCPPNGPVGASSGGPLGGPFHGFAPDRTLYRRGEPLGGRFRGPDGDFVRIFNRGQCVQVTLEVLTSNSWQPVSAPDLTCASRTDDALLDLPTSLAAGTYRLAIVAVTAGNGQQTIYSDPFTVQ